MKNKMETLKVLIFTEHIDMIKTFGSFAKTLNSLLKILKEDKELQERLKQKLKDLK